MIRLLLVVMYLFTENTYATTLCVLDGGGARGALCSRKKYLQTVDQAFTANSIDEMNIYSGFGSEESADCEPLYYRMGNCKERYDDNCTPGTKIDPNSIRGNRNITSEKFSSSQAYSGDVELKSIYESEPFLNSCLPKCQTRRAKNGRVSSMVSKSWNKRWNYDKTLL